MGRLPRITLITPSFQQAGYLEECLRSVHEQGYPDLEHIVVDGGSTDGSAEIIKAHAHELSWWCSERDGGQSDALNKGLSHATGTVFGWINSDDRLLPDSLHHIGRAFAEDPGLHILEGIRFILNPDGSRIPAQQNDPHHRDALFTHPKVNQQSTFYSMEAVRRAGGVDTALHHVMDLELWWRVLFTCGTDHIRVEEVPFADFRMHELSKTGQGLHKFIAEQAAVLHGACLITNEKEIATVLALGHALPQGLRSMEPARGHGERVRRMTLAFLMKWNRQIHREQQFVMMKALRGLVEAHELVQVSSEADVHTLDDQLSAPNWTLFRARRKWKHLFG
jgi:hypothetical protein